MAGAEAAVIACIGAGFFLIYLAKEMEEGNKWIGAAKLFNMAVAFLFFMVATYIGSGFMAADAVGQSSMELLIAILGVLLFLTFVILGISWVVDILMRGWMIQKNKEEEG
jgi:hypothetical protein